MRLFLKHPKPLSQEPSKHFAEIVRNIQIPAYPVADIACGYGRNGAYIACQNHHVIFVDIDKDCLDFIEKGKDVSVSGDIPLNCIDVLNIDLVELWPFKPQSLGGIICVHFYTPQIIAKCIQSLVPNGFLYFETISGRGSNYMSLPYKNEVINQLNSSFNIIFHKEKAVNPINSGKASCTIFAIKQ